MLDWDEMIVTGDDLMAEVVNLYPEVMDFLSEIGMHCVGCAASEMETVRQACRVHGLDPNKVVLQLNRIITGDED